jgi:xanthine dehydrogenase YagS FAD-binding subunit
MHPFTFSRAATLTEAIAAAEQPDTVLIAGGTEMVNWLKEGIVTPARVTDINRLSNLNRIEVDSTGLHLGALARMSEVAAHEVVRREFPAISVSLLKSASPQLRNMASMGGNLLQRTRCPYFRAEVDLPCNKRHPGSGCSAQLGEDRGLAIFGGSEHCVATHPSDVAVALTALDARVKVKGKSGERSIPLVEFYRLPGDQPEIETVLTPGDVIIEIEVPASPLARRSHYVKLRERTSYEFALVSAAVGLELDGREIREARIALGGVAPKPWRLIDAEKALRGVKIEDERGLRASVERGFAEARPLKQNGFKIELGIRLAVRALEQAGGIA